MSAHTRQILIAGAVTAILGVIVLSSAMLLPFQPATSAISLSTIQQTTSSQLTSMKNNSTSSNSTISQLVIPETVQTTNSSLGLQLFLSVNSTIVPSEDAISVSASIFNTLTTDNNLTASNDWAIQGLLSGPCDFGNSTLWPVGIAIFSGNYGMNNLSNANWIFVWPTISCPDTELALGVDNITSYSFLPRNDSGYYSGYLSSTKKAVPMTMSTSNQTISANNASEFNHFYPSLLSSLPGPYTIVAGDEWGQIALLHFNVVASNNIPVMGDFVSLSSGPGGCFVNGNPTFCTVDVLSEAFQFNCAGAAATPSGCKVTINDNFPPMTQTIPMQTTTHTIIVNATSYTVTVWYPAMNQPNEKLGANCKMSIPGDPNSPYFGTCYMVNSTAFVMSDP